MAISASKPFTALVLGTGMLTITAGIAAAQTMVIATDRQGSLMNRVGTTMAKTITDNSKLRVVVRPFAGEGVRISVGEHESVDRVLRIAGSVVEDLPEGHPARG